MRTRILAVATIAVLAASTLSGCFGSNPDDCEASAAAPVAQVLAKPGGGSGGRGGGAKGGSKGKTGSKTKPKKPHTGTGVHHDNDDCDKDD